MEFVFKNIVLKPRVTNWIGYRIPSIEYKDKYKNYKLSFTNNVDTQEELRKKVFSNKELTKLALKNDDELSLRIIDEYPELIATHVINAIDENEIKEKFLLENNFENAKILLNIIYENGSDFDFNLVGSESDYDEFYLKILEVFDDFFSKQQKKKLN